MIQVKYCYIQSGTTRPRTVLPSAIAHRDSFPQRDEKKKKRERIKFKFSDPFRDGRPSHEPSSSVDAAVAVIRSRSGGFAPDRNHSGLRHGRRGQVDHGQPGPVRRLPLVSGVDRGTPPATWCVGDSTASTWRACKAGCTLRGRPASAVMAPINTLKRLDARCFRDHRCRIAGNRCGPGFWLSSTTT